VVALRCAMLKLALETHCHAQTQCLQRAYANIENAGYVCERRNVDHKTGCCLQDKQPVTTLGDVHNTNNLNADKNNKPNSPLLGIPIAASSRQITSANNDNNSNINANNNYSGKDELKQGLDPSTPSNSNRFSCVGCNSEYKCCQNYEFCVSCCLGADKVCKFASMLVCWLIY
jgi:hypothetical protein